MENSKRDEWLFSFPMDELSENPSDQNQNNTDNQADATQAGQNFSDCLNSGEGAESLTKGSVEKISAGADGENATDYDGGCGLQGGHR